MLEFYYKEGQQQSKNKMLIFRTMNVKKVSDISFAYRKNEDTQGKLYFNN